MRSPADRNARGSQFSFLLHPNDNETIEAYYKRLFADKAKAIRVTIQKVVDKKTVRAGCWAINHANAPIQRFAGTVHSLAMNFQIVPRSYVTIAMRRVTCRETVPSSPASQVVNRAIRTGPLSRRCSTLTRMASSLARPG